MATQSAAAPVAQKRAEPMQVETTGADERSPVVEQAGGSVPEADRVVGPVQADTAPLLVADNTPAADITDVVVPPAPTPMEFPAPTGSSAGPGSGSATGAGTGTGTGTGTVPELPELPPLFPASPFF